MSLANSILNSPTRLFLICTALLLILYTWRSPFRSTQPPPTGFIPNKLYEPKAQYCTDNVADETPKIFESINPNHCTAFLLADFTSQESQSTSLSWLQILRPRPSLRRIQSLPRVQQPRLA